jgi:hypothetical protein
MAGRRTVQHGGIGLGKGVPSINFGNSDMEIMVLKCDASSRDYLNSTCLTVRHVECLTSPF